MTRAARVTALGAIAATGVLATVRLGLLGPGPSTSPYELIPLLIAMAFLCVVGLARSSHPSVAWLAIIGASFTATLDLAAYARSVQELVRPDEWRLLGIAVSISAVAAVGAAAGYAASRPRLRRRWLTVGGAAAVGALGLVAIWATTNPSDTTFVENSALRSLALVTRTCIALTAGFTLVGLVGDALPASDRARRRSAAALPATASRRARAATWMRAFGDELSPGRGRARRAVLEERTRVARDIHADVVPGLRQVLAAAESGVPAGQLAGSLREVLSDVEAVGSLRHPIQLEIGGLVPALEWLAERVESRSDLTVTINVADPTDADRGDPPADVSAAAFRIASLALENVVRHARCTTAVLDVRAAASAVDLSVRDDGTGISEDALARARAGGRRGLADMAAEANECGGVLEVRDGPGGSGTNVTFSWRSEAVR